MKYEDPLVEIRDNQHPLQSPNTQLVAALTTLGIPLDEHMGPQHFVADGGNGTKQHSTVWTLQPASPPQMLDGKPVIFRADELIKVWNDDEWLKSNRPHPLAIMRAAFREFTARIAPDGSLKELVLVDMAAALSRDPALRAIDPEPILQRWADHEWQKANPWDPVTIVCTACRNHRALVKWIVEEQGPLAVKCRGKRTAIISRHTTPKDRKRIIDGLNKR